VLQQAQALLQSQADRITDPMLRHAFLTNIVAHREIVEAGRAKG
jgi:hypothetical protein